MRSYSLNSEKAVLFGDFGDSEVGWDEGNRAGVDGHDEGGGRQGLVNGGYTVSWRRPMVPYPRLDWKEGEFEFNFKFTSVMVLYIGVNTMGGIFGLEKPSTIFSMAVGMVIRD